MFIISVGFAFVKVNIVTVARVGLPDKLGGVDQTDRAQPSSCAYKSTAV
jgi:hypothetical protein